jgi:hypothetical protein
VEHHYAASRREALEECDQLLRWGLLRCALEGERKIRDTTGAMYRFVEGETEMETEGWAEEKTGPGAPPAAAPSGTNGSESEGAELYELYHEIIPGRRSAVWLHLRLVPFARCVPAARCALPHARHC